MTGRVIRIFDARKLVINLGSDDGVEAGMQFGVYSPEESIVDPETGDTLGNYRVRKALLDAREVFPRFTIATPPPRRQRIPDDDPRPSATAFGNLLTPRPARYRTVPGRLPVDDDDLQPLPAGTTVQVGDLVEGLAQDSADQGERTASDSSQ